MPKMNMLAMDYGAGSARGILGSFDGSMLSLNEVNRFQNRPVNTVTGIYWNILGLYDELLNTLAICGSLGAKLESLGIDTWGVDYGLIDNQGNLLGNPHSYRDNRTNEVFLEVSKTFSEYDFFQKTGVTPSVIMTLKQLVAAKRKEKAMLDNTKNLLFMPGLLGYFLTGDMSCDNTIAATSLLYDMETGKWCYDLLEKFAIPDILPKINKTGDRIGLIRKELAEETGAGEIPLISVAGHDTASAFAAGTEGSGEDVIYISCGTWSVIGSKVKVPIKTKEAFDNGFSNISGYGNEIIFGTNITGLYILQECEREWKKEGYVIDYDHMQKCAFKSTYESYIDVTDPVFMQPGGMQGKIMGHCKRMNQKPPEGKEEVFKCVILGLAYAYKDVIRQMSMIMGKDYNKINIVGGGSKNRYLCHMTAKLTGIQVIAGPAEATAVGNLMAQLIALKEIKDTNQAVQVIKRSFEQEVF